jgi:two-component system, OmpR family, sensor histidine kinase ChvG
MKAGPDSDGRTVTAKAPSRPRLGAGPRSLRVKLLGLGLLLALFPLLMLAFARTFEQAVVAQGQRRLREAARQAVGADGDALAALGRRLRIELARLDATGAVRARSHTMALALEQWPVTQLGERLVGADAPESLETADAGLALPWPARPEVKSALAGVESAEARFSASGETLVITLAAPLPGGGALYLLAGSHRGVRKLVFVRRELMQLALYEVVLVLPLLVLYGFRVVRPIARLAEAARRYPAAPLADEKLLARGDEIATLARTLTAMAEDLERRRRQASELGADIAHEFKNPLASITASAELLSSTRTLGPERVALISGTIEQSVARLQRSIDELLALLRLEEAVPGEAREPVAYPALLDEVLDEYRRDPRHAGWRFTLDVEAGAAGDDVVLNRRRWAELLRNLIDNALVQPAARQEIAVSVRRTGEGLVTAVLDHGPGISVENQAKVFRRFFTARPPGAPAGTGLGLSVVETIAHAHAGRVELRSTPGQGAEFRVILPG